MLRARVLVLLCVHTVAREVPGATVGFQIHSYDDLREWRQVLNKGAHYLKIDPNYSSNTTFCWEQERVQNKTDARGCFVLNHDTPSPTSMRVTYNTTDDIIALLSDPAMTPYWRRPDRTYIAVCGKSAPAQCSGGAPAPAAAGWMSLIDDFFAAANRAIAEGGLNLEFTLDGDWSPSDCTLQRWRPWVTGWMTGDSPQAAFTSNNASLGYDRFQILNEEDLWFPVAAMGDFGKFVNSSYTYLIWEPSDQHSIEALIDIYVNTSLPHAPGLRFAINIDPAQFEVYSASRTGRAWNVPVPALPHTPTVAPVVVPLYGALLVVSDGAYTVYRFSGYYDSGIANVTGALAWPGHPLPPQPSVTVTSPILTPDENTFVIGGAGSLAAYSLARSDWSVTLVSQVTVPWVAYPVQNSMGSGVMWVVGAAWNDGASCFDVTLHAWTVSTGAMSLLASAHCVFDFGAAVTRVAIGAAMSAAPGVADLVAAVSIDGSQVVQALVLTVSVDGISVRGDVATLGAGTNSSVSVQAGRFIEVHTNGVCWNCEVVNKQTTPALCDVKTGESQAYVLNYNFGAVDDLAKGGNVYPCHDTLFSGTYDVGGVPSAVLVQTDSTVSGIAAVAVHAAAPGDSPVLPIMCGLPNAYDSVVVDAWSLSPWGIPQGV